MLPLFSLDAVVIDTKTTALDPHKTRIVEIGVVRISGGCIGNPGFRQLVDPKEPIPVEAFRVHGIDAEKLRDAPDFSAAWPKFQSFVGEAVQIGHTIGFVLRS